MRIIEVSGDTHLPPQRTPAGPPDELRRFREAAGFSTADAAEVLDCTKGKISRIENGHVPVRSPDLAALITRVRRDGPGSP